MNKSANNTIKLFPEPSTHDISGPAHRQLIGIIGLLLPLALWLLDGLRPTTGLQHWQPLASVSAYYYTQAVSVLAGGLVALTVFLLSYKGYNNEHGRYDRVAAIIAGLAALLVAFFPTATPPNLTPLSWWTPKTGWIHYLSAVVLFSSFIFFCLIQFPRSEMKANLPWDKQVRNYFYIFCGLAIAACLVWAAIASFKRASIFWQETWALEFFALSWLVKGHAEHTLVALGQQTLQYIQDPRQLVDDIKNAMHSEQSAEPTAPPNNP